MLKLLNREYTLWVVVAGISIGLIVWTIIVGDQKRLPEPAAPGPNTPQDSINEEQPQGDTSEGQTDVQGEQPVAPPPATTVEESKPEETNTPENQNGTPNEETEVQKEATPS